MSEQEPRPLREWHQARLIAGGAVARLVEQVDGAGAFREETPDGLASAVTMPLPREGLRAALLVRQAVTAEVINHIGRCRGEGMTWGQLAEQLLHVDSPLAAFQMVGATGTPTFWTCHSCGNRIIDHGPYDPHPSDRERGHALTCQRHRDEVTAHEAR